MKIESMRLGASIKFKQGAEESFLYASKGFDMELRDGIVFVTYKGETECVFPTNVRQFKFIKEAPAVVETQRAKPGPKPKAQVNE
jgi:hypothetical protein